MGVGGVIAIMKNRRGSFALSLCSLLCPNKLGVFHPRNWDQRFMQKEKIFETQENSLGLFFCLGPH